MSFTFQSSLFDCGINAMRIQKFAVLLSAALISGYATAQDPTVGAQSRMSVDNNSNSGDETSATSTVNGLEVIGGFNDYRTDGSIKASFGVSNDGGQSWAHVLVRPPVAFQTGVEGDPMAVYDRRTNTMWAGAVAFGGNGGVYLAKKNAGANNFQPSVMARISGGADKAWMAAGPIPGNPDSTRLYIAYNEGLIWSDDLGQTFNAPRTLGNGLGFLPRVGPNGQLYITYWDTSTGVLFKRSLDGGNTFVTVRAATRMDTWGTNSPNGRVPGNYRIPPIHTMAVNPVNGTISIVYFDNTNTIGADRNLDLYLVKSTDQGTTWSTPARLPFRPLNVRGDMFFPWIEYTPEGRLHLVSFNSGYFDQPDGGTHGFLDQDYALSDDDGVNWSRFRLTPASFDSFFDGRNAGISFLGDYLGMGIGDRTVYPVYPDTHTGQAEVYTNAVFNPIIRPASYSWFRGVELAGSLQSLFVRDADRLSARPGSTTPAREPPIQLEIVGRSPTQNPAYLKLFFWASVPVLNIEQTIQVLNVNTQAWETLDTRAATTSESNTVVTIASPQNYIAPNGDMRARLMFGQTGPAFKAWNASINEAVFLVGP
jgi:hypothetical protein